MTQEPTNGDNNRMAELIKTWRNQERGARTEGFVAGVMAVLATIVALGAALLAIAAKRDDDPSGAILFALFTLYFAYVVWHLCRKCLNAQSD